METQAGGKLLSIVKTLRFLTLRRFAPWCVCDWSFCAGPLRAADWLAEVWEPDAPEHMVWHRKPLSIVALYVFLSLLLYWEFNIPSPGKSVGGLAVAAAVMSFRGEMRGKEKAAWILLLFAFLAVELRSIDQERNANEQLRALARAEEENNFRDIGKNITTGIAGVLDQSHRQFDATMQQFAANVKQSNTIAAGVHGLPDVISQQNKALASMLRTQSLPANSLERRGAVLSARIITYVVDNPTPSYQIGTFAPNDREAIFGQYSYKMRTTFQNRFAPEAAAIYEELNRRGMNIPEVVTSRCQQAINIFLMRQCAEDILMYTAQASK